MKRYRQSLEDILEKLSPIETYWKDDHAHQVIQLLESIPTKHAYTQNNTSILLDTDFDSAQTLIRLILDKSKDQFVLDLREILGEGGIGIRRYQSDRNEYLQSLEALGFSKTLALLSNKPATWRDILVERLKSGRGSAIKGQIRGRALENFTETIIIEVFGPESYDTRCNFVGADGESTAKCDFAIPSKNNPQILIEAKGYGATGSKQSDIKGDAVSIVNVKRSDTNFLFITDGLTWQLRKSDLQELVEYQNLGSITRIYTQLMGPDLKSDLTILREEHGIQPNPHIEQTSYLENS